MLNTAPAAPVEPAVLQRVDWVVANETEFTLLSGSEPTLATIADAASALHCGVVITLGAAGAVVAPSGAPAVAVPSPPVEAVDTTGAGDAFVGTFAVALAAGSSPLDAARLGCTAGALSVQRSGTQTSFPTAAEVLC
jgi:ribokinase